MGGRPKGLTQGSARTEMAVMEGAQNTLGVTVSAERRWLGLEGHFPSRSPAGPAPPRRPRPQDQSSAAACADSTASLVGRVLGKVSDCASSTRPRTTDRAIRTLAFSLRSGEPRPVPALHPLRGHADTRASLSLISLLSSQPILYFSSLSVLYLFHHFPYSLCSLLLLFNWL